MCFWLSYAIEFKCPWHSEDHLQTTFKHRQAANLKTTSKLLEAFLQAITNLIGGVVIDVVPGLARSSPDALVDEIVALVAGVVVGRSV